MPAPRPHRRRLAAGVALAALALSALAACSDDDESAAPTPSTTGPASSASPSSPPASALDAFPVTVRSAFGEAVIPAEPKRVVTIGFSEQDFALALGVTPVAVREYTGGFDWRQRAWARDLPGVSELPTIGAETLNLEQIARFEPDLILGTYSFITQAQFDQLSAIAPTVGDLVDSTSGTGESSSWQEQLEAVGKALGRSQRAAAVQAEVEGRFAEVAAEHPEFATTTLAVSFGEVGAGYFSLEPTDPRMRFFTDLGFRTAATTGALSKEQAAELDVDVLVNAGTTREQSLSSQLFASLDVVREGRTLFYGGYDAEFLGALGFTSPLSLPYAIDLVLPDLVAATDDDPATTVKALR